MRSGRLRHRVTIQQKTRTSDGMGGYTESWADVDTVWAAVEPLKMRERFEAEQIQTETTHRILIRYISGITAEMRILFDSQYYYIDSIINPDYRNRELILMTKEDLVSRG